MLIADGATAASGAMSSVVSALTNASTGLTASTMFGVVADLVPFTLANSWFVWDKSILFAYSFVSPKETP